MSIKILYHVKILLSLNAILVFKQTFVAVHTFYILPFLVYFQTFAFLLNISVLHLKTLNVRQI